MAIELDIRSRPRELSPGFHVRRLLPAVARRMVGPFIFVDHMGPAKLAKGQGLDVRPHPHIGLSTVTYLFDGEILHRDSLGSEQPIRPGAVNWMTAGRGIVHSERSPAAARKTESLVHGMQLWVALPLAQEEVAPSFHHHPSDSIPMVERPGARLRVIAGAAYGATSPVEVSSPLYYVEARLERGVELELPEEYPERAVYVVEGAAAIDGHPHGDGEMAVLAAGPSRVQALQPARVLLLGGQPLEGERFIEWNFVASSKARIERAKADWRARLFPLVPGDDKEFIPLP